MDHSIDKEFFERVDDVEVAYDFMLQAYGVYMKKLFLGREKQVNFDFQYPNGVWQLWKQIYAPDWFNRIFPVKFKTSTVSRNFTEVFPNLPVPENRQYEYITFYHIKNNESICPNT